MLVKVKEQRVHQMFLASTGVVANANWLSAQQCVDQDVGCCDCCSAVKIDKDDEGRESSSTNLVAF